MAAFDFAKVKDPTFFKENVLNAHASFRTYASREEYRTGSSSLALKLDGIWKFAYAKNYTSAIPGFEKTDYDCSGWDDIHVPAHIQMEGYDIPQYANVQYPWDGREEVQPGEIPQRFNPVASYVKYFELPESMQGKPVHIEFEGVESGMALWLNGSYVGYTEDSFSAHTFDLTPYLQPGVNKLPLCAASWSGVRWNTVWRTIGILKTGSAEEPCTSHTLKLDVDRLALHGFRQLKVFYSSLPPD
ncbi:sugar-binding domain-containing protein [Faecalibacterium hattorii]|uniref:sugar-binding domain-containing protein n=1 Tax=Faecalibacterium hattorii TaxID=2935520 RepID=UPI003AB0B0B1